MKDVERRALHGCRMGRTDVLHMLLRFGSLGTRYQEGDNLRGEAKIITYDCLELQGPRCSGESEPLYFENFGLERSMPVLHSQDGVRE